MRYSRMSDALKAAFFVAADFEGFALVVGGAEVVEDGDLDGEFSPVGDEVFEGFELADFGAVVVGSDVGIAGGAIGREDPGFETVVGVIIGHGGIAIGEN